MAVADLNRMVVKLAELNKDFNALVNKANEIFDLIEDEEEKVAYYAPFDDGINAAEVALNEAAKWVQEEAIIKLSNEE